MGRPFRVLAVVLPLLGPGIALAGTISNWAAPPIWTPDRAVGIKSALSTTYPAVPFIPISPCRLADTRGNGFSGEYGPPSLAGGSQRNFTIGGQCGIPTGAQAVSLNFTVWAPVTRGDIRVFPAGSATPTVSTLNWEANILAQANAALAPLGTGGAITVQVDGTGTIDLFIDVNGYYATDVSASPQGLFIQSLTGYAIVGTANFIGVAGSGGTYGVAGSTSNGYGVYGAANGSGTGVMGKASSGTGMGVLGKASSNTGVRGESTSGAGVHGVSGSYIGVFGESSMNHGIWGTTNASSVAGVYGTNYGNGNDSQGVGGYAGGPAKVFGVRGQLGPAVGAESAAVHGLGVSGLAGKTYAVLGETPDTNLDAAAVLGRLTGGGAAQGIPSFWLSAGVRAESYNTGVLAFANGIGVLGRAYTPAGVSAGYGILGYNNGSSTYGVYGGAGGAGTTKYGVYAAGDLGASGTKSFVEPHPTKAGTVIRYVALEGPEAGTYFRGRGRFVRGGAVVEVPEDFRLVTDEEGLTVQVTPIGDFAQVAAVSIGLDVIELKATRDVEFSFLVQGVRKTFRDWKVVVQSDEFMPEGPAATIPAYLSEEQKRNLIRNGTYHEDGTVNMGTARRVGWDEAWTQRRANAAGRSPSDPLR